MIHSTAVKFLSRGGTRSENCWGCAVGHWKLDPKRSRGKWYFGAKKIEFCEDLYPKDRFCVGGWEKTPQKDRVWYPEAQKRGSKPRHICITHHIGSTPPRGFSACKILGTTIADRKLELGHNALVYSTTCVRYPDRLLLQNTIYLVNKSLLNTKIHLPAWQQLTDCETNVNPDQTFCFWVLLADVMRLMRNGHCACLTGSDMRSS